MDWVWSPRAQGNLGEFSAMEWLVRQGAWLLKPVFEHPDYDLVADFAGQLVRVQVKTSGAWHRGRFAVSLCTRGGNQSWNRIIKHLDASRCDAVFVHVADGRRWYIPSAELGGRSSICVGGPKYSEFEIEGGERFPSRSEAMAEADRSALRR
jgi:Holliday junction resolvase-like predicted endonuclease